jgi:hypothetical protein
MQEHGEQTLKKIPIAIYYREMPEAWFIAWGDDSQGYG